MKVIRVDGRVIDIVTNGTAINYSGKPAVMSIVRDITEQKTAERQLCESEAKLQELFDEAPVGYHEIGIDQRITRVNQTELEMLGYSAEEMLGRPVWEFIVEAENARHDIAAKLSGSKPVGDSFERTHTRKDGTTFPTLSRDMLLKDEQGRIIGCRATMQDISARKHAEEQYRTIIQTAIDGFCIVDRQGRYLEVNDAYCRLLGYKREELMQIRVSDIEAVETSDEMAQHFHRIIEKGSDVFETLYRRKDRTIIDVQINTQYSNLKGGVFIAFMRDITNQKRLETQLRQSQKMEAIGSLAGGIAHDFNNILSAVIGYGELGIDGVPEDSDLKYKLQEIINAGYRARDLIKQILVFSRESEQEIKPISVKYIAKEALKMLRASIPSTIEIRDEIRSDTMIMGDPTQVHQVIMNLCTNAAHAMQESVGVLTLSLDDEEIISESEIKRLDLSPGPYLKLSVRDTGRGIPADIIDKIFDPFFTTKEKDEGTGLGLSVVHGIVKSLGGAISVYSEPDKGTTFEIHLPAIQTETEAQETVQAILPTGTEHILMVDDEKAVVDIGKQSLEKQGYRVTTRTSSIEALELFKVRSMEFDLMVTDLTMPNMTGLELSKEIKNIRPDIPIILCSGFAEQVSEMSLKEHGIVSLVRKPMGRNELIQTVRRVLDMKSDSTD